jgi:hypothetical protein
MASLSFIYNPLSLFPLSLGPLVPWSLGPLVPWSLGPSELGSAAAQFCNEDGIKIFIESV